MIFSLKCVRICFCVHLLFIIVVLVHGVTPQEGKRRKCYLDYQEFEMLVEKSPCFVDKSMLIKDFWDLNTTVLVTAPRKFGKTVNLQMMKLFLQFHSVGRRTNNKFCRLFQNNSLFISRDTKFFEEHCGKHPIIYLDFKYVRGGNFQELLKSYKQVLNDAFREHTYLLKREKVKYTWAHKKLEYLSLPTFLEFWNITHIAKLDKNSTVAGSLVLSEALYTHFQTKVVVLIDEFDAPIWNLFERKFTDDDIKETLDFFHELVTTFFKSNPYLDRAFIQACSRLSGYLSSSARNIVIFPFLGKHGLTKYYGLTEDEVKGKLEQFGIGDKYEEVAEWYDGYLTAFGAKMYGIWSIIKYFETEKLKNYWVEISGIRDLKEIFLKIPKFQEYFYDLLQWQDMKTTFRSKVSVTDINNLRDVLLKHEATTNRHFHTFVQFLTDNGYFNRFQVQEGIFTVKVPNQEIHDYLFKAVYSREYINRNFRFDTEKLNTFVESTEYLGSRLSTNNSFVYYKNYITDLFSDVPRPESELAFKSALYYPLTVSDQFQVVDVQVSKEVGGERRTADIVVIRKDETLLVIQAKCFSEVHEERQLRLIDKKYLDTLIDGMYRYKVYSKSNRIYISLFLNNAGSVEMSYLLDYPDRKHRVYAHNISSAVESIL